MPILIFSPVQIIISRPLHFDFKNWFEKIKKNRDLLIAKQEKGTLHLKIPEKSTMPLSTSLKGRIMKRPVR